MVVLTLLFFWIHDKGDLPFPLKKGLGNHAYSTYTLYGEPLFMHASW